MAEEIAWLIEWPENDQLPVRWWHPVHGWCRDANKAIRFSRKVDAEDYLATQRFLGGMRVAEHKWVMA